MAPRISHGLLVALAMAAAQQERLPALRRALLSELGVEAERVPMRDGAGSNDPESFHFVVPVPQPPAAR